MSKTYTLELTAEEAMNWDAMEGYKKVSAKLAALEKQARLDRAQDDLRLPWSADSKQRVRMSDPCGYLHTQCPSDRVAKLMSAAPELLEAVQAMKEMGFSQGQNGEWVWAKGKSYHIGKLVDRALRKVETGVPE